MFSVFSFSKISSIQTDPKKDDWNIKVTKSKLRYFAIWYEGKFWVLRYFFKKFLLF